MRFINNKTLNSTFESFTFFGVTNTTELYNNTYFNYGGIVGIGYPNSQWDRKYSDFLLPTLKNKQNLISNYIFSVEMNMKTMRVIFGGYEDLTVKRVANSSRNASSLI